MFSGKQTQDKPKMANRPAPGKGVPNQRISQPYNRRALRDIGNLVEDINSKCNITRKVNNGKPPFPGVTQGNNGKPPFPYVTRHITRTSGAQLVASEHAARNKGIFFDNAQAAGNKGMPFGNADAAANKGSCFIDKQFQAEVVNEGRETSKSQNFPPTAADDAVNVGPANRLKLPCNHNVQNSLANKQAARNKGIFFDNAQAAANQRMPFENAHAAANKGMSFGNAHAAANNGLCFIDKFQAEVMNKGRKTSNSQIFPPTAADNLAIVGPADRLKLPCDHTVQNFLANEKIAQNKGIFFDNAQALANKGISSVNAHAAANKGLCFIDKKFQAEVVNEGRKTSKSQTFPSTAADNVVIVGPVDRLKLPCDLTVQNFLANEQAAQNKGIFFDNAQAAANNGMPFGIAHAAANKGLCFVDKQFQAEVVNEGRKSSKSRTFPPTAADDVLIVGPADRLKLPCNRNFQNFGGQLLANHNVQNLGGQHFANAHAPPNNGISFINKHSRPEVMNKHRKTSENHNLPPIAVYTKGGTEEDKVAIVGLEHKVKEAKKCSSPATPKKMKDPIPTAICTTQSEQSPIQAFCGGFDVEMTKAENLLPNIDEIDLNNQLAVVEYVEDIYKFYRETEGMNCVQDYMPSQLEINDKMRAVLVNWLIEVHLKYKLTPETLYLATNLLDRYLSTAYVSRKDLQLVGVTAMLLACKYEEVWPPEINDFVHYSGRAYTRPQILAMEKNMLKKLKFDLTVPTPYVFLVRFLKAADSDKEMENLVFFLSELSLLHYVMIKFTPSLVAASAVYTARCALKKEPIWTNLLKHHSGYSEADLMECANLMITFHQKSAQNYLKVVHKKYSAPRFSCVACISPAKLPV